MRTMSNSVGIVFCVHHKPWLMQGSLITAVLQDYTDTDFYFAYQQGDGVCAHKPSYQEYLELAKSHGVDPQLSPYDSRVREVCQIPRDNIHELVFENDGALDSGAWYKFLRTGLWEKYDYVCFFGEGTLLTSPRALSAIIDFARAHNVHFIASGHEKKSVCKSEMLCGQSQRKGESQMNAFHDAMSAKVFELFCRDSEFKALFDKWPDEFRGEIQNHVVDMWPRPTVFYRMWAAANMRDAPSERGSFDGMKSFLRKHREELWSLDELFARIRLGYENSYPAKVLGLTAGAGGVRHRHDPYIHVSGVRRKLSEIVSDVTVHDGIRFHRETRPEWFGCTIAHVMSRTFLQSLTQKLEQHNLYDVLEVPYTATPLEVIWGFLPGWIGVEKWFTDGIHRVRKNFATLRREDDEPISLAGYINRYYRGQAVVVPGDDCLKVTSFRWSLSRIESELGANYFVKN